MSDRSNLLDVNHPFFRPLWRRVLTVVLPLAWAGVEIATGSVGWGMLFGAAGLYAGYQFFVVKAAAGEEGETGAGDGPDHETDR